MRFKQCAVGTAVVLGIAGAAPALAQQQQEGAQAQDQILTQEQAQQQGAPLYVSPSVVRRIEQALNDQGYDAGEIDGNWDTQSQTALRNYQQAVGLEPTGQLNGRTISSLGIDVSSEFAAFTGEGGGQEGMQQQEGAQQQDQELFGGGQPQGEQPQQGDQPIEQEENGGLF